MSASSRSMALEWAQEESNLFTAPGGYSVECRVGHWMTFVPDEDQAIYISPPGFDYSDDAKRWAERHAQQQMVP